MGGQTPGAANQPVRHGIFQTSLMSELLDGVYDGDLSVAQLLEHGDFGLGTFSALDGEMVVMEGVCYQLHDGGRARIADAKALTPFAVVTDFIPMHRVDLPADSSRERVAALIGETISSENYLYAIRVTGEFAWVSTRTAARQQQPYPPLREATRNEPVIRFDDVEGIVAGFRRPLYELGIGVAGGHVHFIDSAREQGGHVLDYLCRRGTLEICLGSDLHLSLPLSDAFGRAHLAPDDLADQVQQTENHR